MPTDISPLPRSQTLVAFMLTTLFKMEVKSWTLKVLVTLVVIYFTPIAKADDCCSYGVETDHEGQFERITAGSVIEEMYPYLSPDGVCPPLSCANLEGPRQTGLSLQSVNVIYDAKCQRLEGFSVGEDCRKREEWSYIALNISYKISFRDGSNFQGIIFSLKNLSGAYSETVGSIKMCQYITLNDTLGEEEAGGKIFYFTGFVGLHPGARYEVIARLMCNDVSINRTVQIPYCDDKNTLVKKNDYFCNKDPASFLPKIGVHQNLSAWWTVYPKGSPFTHFVTELVRKGSTNVIERALVFYNESQYKGADMIMTHQFSRRSPGEYEVRVYGQPDEGCREGLHWRYCRGIKCDVTAAYADPVPPTDQDPEDPENTTPVVPEPHESDIPPPFELFMIIVVTLLVTVTVLVGFAVMWLIKSTSGGHSDFGSIPDCSTVNEEIVGEPLDLVKEKTWPIQCDAESQNSIPFLQNTCSVTLEDSLWSR